MTNNLPIIEAAKDELTAIFKDLHQHPELGFAEYRTAGVVAEKLKEYGVDEVHTGVAGTGVVGIINGGEGSRRVGLRADMDALPIDELTNLAYASKTPGVMHACGHDGHTTMLLGAAKHLAKTRDFKGKTVLIFQPAEEGLGGARGMLNEGLFERFPCDEIYGLHNSPNGKPGTVGICKGTAMAGASFFDITVQGKGSHAAMPHQSRDPLVITSDLVGSMQTILSRNIPPLETCVLSITQIHSGSAYNIVPDTATLAGTIRYFKKEICDLAEQRMREVCSGFANAYGVEIDIDLRNTFDVLINDPTLSDAYLEAAEDIVGRDNISGTEEPATGSEDFADMLNVVPGAYCRIGHSGTTGLHNPSFFLDPNILPVGASVMARIVERRLSQ
tara:strand:- start:2559 stop:3722 length:1164 start_codon:yes stop_codon:yes gene_type:complete